MGMPHMRVAKFLHMLCATIRKAGQWTWIDRPPCPGSCVTVCVCAACRAGLCQLKYGNLGGTSDEGEMEEVFVGRTLRCVIHG